MKKNRITKGKEIMALKKLLKKLLKGFLNYTIAIIIAFIVTLIVWFIARLLGLKVSLGTVILLRVLEICVVFGLILIGRFFTMIWYKPFIVILRKNIVKDLAMLKKRHDNQKSWIEGFFWTHAINKAQVECKIKINRTIAVLIAWDLVIEISGRKKAKRIKKFALRFI